MEVFEDLTPEELRKYQALTDELRLGKTLGNSFQEALPGTSIRELDMKFPIINVQDRVRQRILISEEALLAACQFTGGARQHLFPWSVYALVRTCIENVATVHWILSPSSASESFARAALLEARETDWQISYRGHLSTSPEGEKTTSDLIVRAEKLRSAARANGATRDSPLSMTQRVIAFDKATRREGVSYSFQAWTIFSAAVHGESWAVKLISAELPQAAGTIMQDRHLADRSVGLGAWALKQVHDSFSALSGLDLSPRIPNDKYQLSLSSAVATAG